MPKTNLRYTISWSVLDQLVLSALHFALGLLVLRFSSKEGYGVYALSWSLLMLLGGLQNAFVNTQLVVRAAGLPSDEQQRLCAAFLFSQSLLYAGLLIAALFAALIAYAFDALTAAGLVATIAITFGGTALREFVRSVLRMQIDARAVFGIDIRYAAALVLLTAGAITFLEHQWLPATAILALGLSSAIAAAPFCWKIWRHREALTRSWHHFLSSGAAGSWAALGVIITHVQSQSYVYLLSAFAGLAATAEASAARLLLTPVSLAFSSIQRMLLPHYVVLDRQDQHQQASRLARRLLIVTTIGLLGYAAVLVYLSGNLVTALFGPGYAASSSYILLFSGLVWAEIARSIASLQLQAHARFRDIALRNALTATAVVAASSLTVPQYGVFAAITVQGLGELLLAALLWNALHRHLKNRTSPGCSR